MSETATQSESAVQGERPRRRWTPEQRERIMAGRKRTRGGDAGSAQPDVELIAEDVVSEAVDNVKAIATMFVMPVAPYTGVTLAGVPDPEKKGEWLVRSRAEMAGAVLLEHAKSNPRMLAIIHRFNLMLKNVALVEVVGSVVASVAVDAHLVEPDAAVVLPGGVEYPILMPAIGDVIEYVASQQGARPEVGTVKLERQSRRTESAEGVAAPADPWNGELTPEQRAEAAQMRARLAERDRLIENGDEPTLRREGQTIVPGDVTGT